MKTLYVIACVFLFSAFAKAQDSTNVNITSPVIALKIPLGQTVQIKEMLITFIAVTEDSRCPKNVQCMWQGEVTVKINVSDATSLNQEVMTTIQSPTSPIIFENPDYLIRAITVSPYPDSTITTDPTEYTLLLKVEEK